MEKINVTETFLPPLEGYFQLLEKVWRSKTLTNRGAYVKELEGEIQKYLGSKNKPLAVGNGTLAIQIAIKSLSLSGEIITTPFSYVATTSSLVWENCKPVFVDVHYDHLTIDAELIESAITEKTSAILATHVFGNTCEIEKIKKIADKYNLKVIYDAAHSFGVKYNGKSVFDYGDISTCSFHCTKLFHTGEGGAIFCNDSNFKDDIYLKHNFGHNGEGIITGVGINGKLSEIHAVLGLSVLPHINDLISTRKRVNDFYTSNLNFRLFRGLKIRQHTEFNYSYFPIIFKDNSLLLKAISALNTANIFPRRYFYPSLNTLEYVDNVKCPISDEVSDTIICLPMSHKITIKQMRLICDIINKIK